MSDQKKNLHDLIDDGDVACLNNLRMDTKSFYKLSYILENRGGLTPTKYISVNEQVAMFLSVLAHHTKNRIVGHNFKRSGETVSKIINKVLKALLAMHPVLLAGENPINEDCDMYTWQPFQGFIGALDGTYVRVNVRLVDRPRYRSRKGDITTNVLAACNENMLFSYILAGWEGSAADGRVLRDAVNRPNGLRVPEGNYYLCDNGYTNGEGFLTPYRGVRYHLKEWDVGLAAPQNREEYFNMRHSRARNVIERSFGSLKARWSILRSPTFYPVKIQNHLIMSCAFLHNFIRNEMAFDPLDLEDIDYSDDEEDQNPEGYIDVVEPSNAWTAFRDDLAENMYTTWLQDRG